MSDVPAQSTAFSNWAASILTMFLCCLLTYITVSLVEGRVQPTFRDVVIGLVGFITAKLSTSYDFYYGTSSANKKQSETISTMATTQAAAQAALAPVITIPVAVAPAVPPVASPVVATVATPHADIPLHAGETATVKADPAKPAGEK